MNEYRDPDMFDVRAALRTITDATREYWKVVLISTITVLILLTLYIIYWPPVYIAEASMFVEKDTDSARDAYYASWVVFRKDDARTEIEMMTSGDVLREVVRREHLRYKDVYHPFMSHTRYLWEKSWVGSHYKKTKEWIFPPEPDPHPLTEAEKELGRTINDMGAGITIKAVGESNFGRLTVKGANKNVNRIANTLMDVYLQKRAQRYQNEARQAFDLLNAEVAKAENTVQATGARRIAFSRKNGLTFDFQKEVKQVDDLTKLESDIAANRARVAALQASLSEVDKQLATEPATRKTSTITELNAVRESAKNRRLELQIALIQTAAKYRDDSPEVKEIKDEMGKLDEIISKAPESLERGSTESINPVRQTLVGNRNALLTDLQGTKAALSVIEGTASRLHNRLADVTAEQFALRDLDRAYANAMEVYQALQMKRAQTAVTITTAALAMPSMRIVDYAMPPDSKYWPKTKYLYPGGVVLGLCLGIGIAVVLSLLDGRVRRSNIAAGTDLPIYSSLTIIPERVPLTVVRDDRPAIGSGS